MEGEEMERGRRRRWRKGVVKNEESGRYTWREGRVKEG